ncbi:MAG: hypothetical protein Kow0032_21710 [Methyloligellaceae bacterium]
MPASRTPLGIDALAARTGQVVEATVLARETNGATRLLIANRLFSLLLPVAAEPGSQIRLQVSQGADGRVQVAVAPRPPVSIASRQQGAAAPARSIAPSTPTPAVPPSAAAPGAQTAASQPPSATQPAVTPRSTAAPQPPAASSPQAGARGAGVLPQAAPQDAAQGVKTTAVSAQQGAVRARAAPQQAPAGPSAGAPAAPLRGTGAVQHASTSPSPHRSAAAASRLPAAVSSAHGRAAAQAPPSASAGTIAAQPGLQQSAAAELARLRSGVPAAVSAPLQPVLVEAARLSVARQDSLGALIASLTGLGGKRDALPRPVGEAAARLLAGRVTLDQGALDGAKLKQALLRSGIFLEHGLASGQGAAQLKSDIKAILLSLRNALGGWLGDEAQQTARSDRPPPPARGALPQAHSSPPSAKAAGAAAVSEAPLREAGRLLLTQSEAALARTRLHQIVSLPDDGAGSRMVRGAPAGDLSLELPLALGGETAMAQFRIAADREGRGGSEPGGWQMEFSLAFRETGEVGARVALRSRRIGVRLWAERGAVAQRLEAALPELREALEANGLKPGVLQVRQGAPRQPARLPGAFMDEVS